MASQDTSFGNLIVEIGRLFINKPYRSDTLEKRGKEKLILNLSGFDCSTFVETVLALALCTRRKISPAAFRRNLKLIRYRHGRINGYSSRLHYFTDWLQDNEKKGILTDVTRSLGGRSYHKRINFMTSHQELYPALKNEAILAAMSAIEKKLSRQIFYRVDQDKVDPGKIKNGDVIAFTAHRKGLDVAHLGFALWQGKSLRLLHASSKQEAVVISKKNLVAYLKSNKKFTGIIIARPL